MGSNAEYAHEKALERIAKLEADLAAANATIERLSAPVSDEEGDEAISPDPGYLPTRWQVNALITARKGK